MNDKPSFKEGMKQDVTFATVKGIFIGAIAGSLGMTIGNLVTTKLDTLGQQNFTDKFKQRSKGNLPFAAIVGGIAGAVYYGKSAKDYNKAIDEKWTVKISKQEQNAEKGKEFV